MGDMPSAAKAAVFEYRYGTAEAVPLSRAIRAPAVHDQGEAFCWKNLCDPVLEE
jgi:hypothetical protein